MVILTLVSLAVAIARLVLDVLKMVREERRRIPPSGSLG
jgi:hypothetical protein